MTQLMSLDADCQSATVEEDLSHSGSQMWVCRALSPPSRLRCQVMFFSSKIFREIPNLCTIIIAMPFCGVGVLAGWWCGIPLVGLHLVGLVLEFDEGSHTAEPLA